MKSSLSADCEVSYGGLSIVTAIEEEPPFEVQAVVTEEDTCLLLTVGPEIEEPTEGYRKLISQALGQVPQTPGTVLVKEGYPLRLFAIVHDLDREPTWDVDWIRSALQAILQETETRKLEAIALPLLGGRHGSLQAKDSVELLGEALDTILPRHLRRVWLIVPPRTRCDLLDPLRATPLH